ncbi:MAG: AAA family ATPase [Alloprevotella sp.]|nr:AAA family ATPase [Alloprevotella sp.]MBR1652678.1 AAA family ATPase [Alloprevotella sp.]
MVYETLAEQIALEFAHPFTPGQAEAALKLAHFITNGREQLAFVLRGYAGTGKTSLVGALVRVMQRLEREVVLLAPTGRAAKVFSSHAGVSAYTIHKTIYRQQTFQGEGTRFSLGFNRIPHTLFIVDEASMLANQGGMGSIFGTGLLLDDLIHYAYEAPGCRVLFVGDTAQLPPVGEAQSPALSADVLRSYGLDVYEADLTEVVRQAEGSDVLTAATRLRQQLQEAPDALPLVEADDHGEVRYVDGEDLIESLVEAYGDCGTQQTIVVTRSNKRANIYNAGIRARIFDREDLLTRGDMVMAVKNNYYWAEKLQKTLGKDETLPFDFIANGDTAEVVRLHNVHEQYGFRFADATLRFPDYDDYELDCRVLLDTLTSESPSLTAEESRRLYESVLEDYMHIPSKRERMKALRQDEYYNALQLKFAYAVTCHKAQGGQWARVFVDQGYVPPEVQGAEYLRWLYTAFTRTTERLLLVNWPREQRR